MSADIGGIFEEQLEKTFQILNNDCLLQWHAFPDTKRSNGGAISTQPSDYLVGLPLGCNVEQRMMFVEAKASDKHKSLQKSSVRPGQRGFIHRWRMLLDLPYFILHYSSVTGELQLWDGKGIAVGNRPSKNFLLGSWKVGAGREMDSAEAAEALKRFYALPPKHEAVKLYRQQGD